MAVARARAVCRLSLLRLDPPWVPRHHLPPGFTAPGTGRTAGALRRRMTRTQQARNAETGAGIGRRTSDCLRAIGIGRGRRTVVQAKTLTALAMTRPRMAIEMSDCTAIAAFAQAASGITSVGLKATPFVTPRYR